MKQKFLDLEQQRVNQIFELEKLPIINATPEELYRIAEINPKLFSTKYTRWGCVFKCVKCNGYRVNTGGIRSLLQISRIVNEQKYEHRKYCKHPKWEEKWSLHKAEIPHTFVEVTTDQTKENAGYADITGATIASGSFTASRKYLFMYSTWITTTNTARDGSVKALHGSTDFAESELEIEPMGDNRLKQLWFTVWTAISSEAIKLQHEDQTSGHFVKNDIITLTSIEISEDLTEGSDWDFNHDSSSRSLDQTFTADASLTIQTADHTAGDTYLVISYARFENLDVTVQHESRLVRSGEASSTEPTWSEEGEEGAGGKMIQYHARTFDLGASDNTFTVESRRDEATGSPTIEHSSVFALNLEKFKDSNEIYTDAGINLGTTDWADLVQTLSMTPSQTGDIFILGYIIADLQGGSEDIQTRMQVDNSDQPTGQSAYPRHTRAIDGDDQMGQVHITVENLDNTSHTVDLDGDTRTTTGSPHSQSRQLVMFSLELASAAAVRTLFQSTYPRAPGMI